MLHEKQQHVSNQCMPAIVQTQSQAKHVFVTTLKMDNFDCTKRNAHFTACLWEGLFQEWKHKLLAPPPYPLHWLLVVLLHTQRRLSRNYTAV